MGDLRYFWYWDSKALWPPATIRTPEQFTGGERLCVACTQTDLSSSAQNRLVKQWCGVLPTLKGVKHLWLNSRAPQRLFDAACQVPELEGLWLKWSGVKSLEALTLSRSLRALHMGSSTGVRSIDVLSQMSGLRWLGLENLKLITSLDPLRNLKELVGLAVEGSMWSTQHVDSLRPIGDLVELRFLSLVNLRSRDKTLEPLFRLNKLEALQAATWWNEAELEELRRRNPGLAV